MDSGLFLRGLLIGFSIAAVVGPIGLLCIQRTLHQGFLPGLVTGLGAATADATYGSVAAFGLTIITTFLVKQALWIHVFGGLFLIYLGIKTLLTKPDDKTTSVRADNLFGAYATTFVLTLTNPATILSFIAIFAGIGMGASQHSVITAIEVVCGVFLGSVLWWCFLSGGITLLRKRFASSWLLWINRLSGCGILFFGIITIISLKL